ncbi:hypothetical protein FHETE_3811 [Fusarium heterosporum]|uniref:Uncharacterized protein n=1 Tax=Fusarium heterosporum TaxID=42747 RepID=A0A8H5TMW1_FUSHE|nr:hypothetical protein FHETE_3811 [Fusarium heterosporum]
MNNYKEPAQEEVTATIQPLMGPPKHAYSPSSSSPLELQGPIIISTHQKEIQNRVLPFLHQWCKEILALLSSLLSFVALSSLLFASNEQPITKWTNLPITLNTLVSILASISKINLAYVISMCFSQAKWGWFSGPPQPLIDFDRFDAASRGATGSFRLVRSCVRHPHWIALGALTAISLLVFEPFTQAILAFESRSVVLTAHEYAQIARANNQTLVTAPVIGQSTRLDASSWLGFGGGENGLGRRIFPGKDNTTLIYQSDLFASQVQDNMGMKAALWNGFSPLNTAKNLQPAYNCASGNCTWPNFASLAVCHKCYDMSQLVVKTSGIDEIPDIFLPATWDNGSYPNISNASPGANYKQRLQTLAHTNYNIPSMNLRLGNYNGKSRCKSTNDNCPDTYFSMRITTNPGQTINFQNSSTLIMSMLYLDANECALFFCVNEYQDAVSQGALSERIMSSWTDKTSGSYSAGGNISEYLEYTNHTLDMGGALAKVSDLQLRIPDEYFRTSNLPTQTFNITQTTVISLLNILNEGFWGYDKESGYTDLAPQNWIYPAIGWRNKPLGFVSGLAQSKDKLATIKNVAQSLKKWIRDYELEKTPNKGSATDMVIIIRVQWYFFVVPALILVAGLMFILLCTWETLRLRRPVLKDSILATLACAPDRDLKEKLKQAALAGGLEALGKEAMVIWEKDEGFGRLECRE